MMVPVQLQAQDLPVLPAHVTPEDKSKQQRAEVGKQAWKEKKRGTQREKKRGRREELRQRRREEEQRNSERVYKLFAEKTREEEHPLWLRGGDATPHNKARVGDENREEEEME